MTKKVEMDRKLDALYKYIAETVVERGFPPSVRELCVAMNMPSTSTAFRYLRKLEERKLIRLSANTSRGMEVLGPKPLRDKTLVKEIGRVPAGNPVLAFEDHTETYELPNNLFHNLDEDVFILKVFGRSMINIGIYDGDRILVRRQDTATNGQVVVALIDGGDTTVKRFYLEDGTVRLHPENDGMCDLFPNECTILGVAIGLIRTSID